jgi:hypothetical protein
MDVVAYAIGRSLGGRTAFQAQPELRGPASVGTPLVGSAQMYHSRVIAPTCSCSGGPCTASMRGLCTGRLKRDECVVPPSSWLPAAATIRASTASGCKIYTAYLPLRSGV